MSTWFTELAGKAENILNKIDKNAASVLKHDAGEKDQLLNGKSNGHGGHATSPLKQITPSPNSMKLTGSPKVPTYKKTNGHNDDSGKIDNRYLSAMNAEDGVASVSNASNSSRRSSWSSKTEGVQSVIEMPLGKSSLETSMTNGNGHAIHTSVSSASLNNNSMDDKNEMVAMKIVLAQIKLERDQLKGDIIELQQQLATAQNEHVIADLQVQCERLSNDKENLQRRIDEIESGNKHQSQTISEFEATVAMQREKENDLNERLTWAKRESEQAANELQQYRTRAQQTLQSKDDVIAELRSLHQRTDVIDDTDIDAQFKQIEWNKMQQEQNALVEELNGVRGQLSAKTHIIDTLETKYHDAELRHKEYESSLSSDLKQERIKSSQLEESVRMQSRELEAVREELKRHHSSTAAKLHEKQKELSELRAKLSQQKAHPTIPKEPNNFDDRVYSLTQSLVQKQNTLEMITADRNAIRLQLEKLEYQHRETMQLLRRQHLPQIINMNDTDDAKSQLPNFMQENPFDTHVARRVKRVYSTLDAAGVRMGVLLRRYPLIRTLVLVYVTFLHLWVMFVLLISTPN